MLTGVFGSGGGDGRRVGRAGDLARVAEPGARPGGANVAVPRVEVVLTLELVGVSNVLCGVEVVRVLGVAGDGEEIPPLRGVDMVVEGERLNCGS